MTAVSIYRVTSSAVESLTPGQLIIDRGDESPRTWHLFHHSSGDMTAGWSGVKVGDVCPACWAEGHPGALGHDDEHGTSVPHAQPTDTTTVEVAR